MNKKFLIAAMALPMLFTACSQEELFEGVNTMDAPQAKGLYVTLAPTLGEGVGSRAQWDGSKLTWENTDKISMYWLDNASTTNALYGKYNSVFKTEDGEAFTSESMVFVGNNIAVYPGNTSFVKPGTIALNVPTSQDENTIEQTPYISNLLAVADPDEYSLDKQVAGYNNGLYSPMKMAANVLVLNLELANTEKLIANYGFKIDSVSLVSKTPAFASTANLLAAGDAKDKGVIKFGKDNKSEYESIVSAVKVDAPAKYTALTTKHIEGEDGNYQVKFVVLPTDVKDFDEDAEIVIYTNCGRINLTTTSTKGDKTSNIASFPVKEDKEAVYAGVVTGAKNEKGEAVDQTIADLLNQITSSQVGSKDTKFEGEFIGKKATRTVKADMSDATLNDSKVFNSENILNYVAIHTAMNSKEEMNLILSTTAKDGIFKTLTKEAIAAVDAKNTYNDKDASKEVYKVTLSLGEGVEAIEIVGGGAVYNAGKSLKEEAALILADAEWTMNDNASWTNVSKVINNGTLTIAGTTTKNVQNKLAEEVQNYGTLKIAGNGKLHVDENLINKTWIENKQTYNGVVEIAAKQNLVFDADVTEGIEGIFNVAQGGFLTLAKNVTVTSNATINNYGLVSAEDGVGGLTNEGTIYVKRNGAITYIQDNENGIINLLSRNNEVVVKENPGKIVYNYVSATDGSTFKRVADDKFTYVVFGEGNENITLAKADAKEGIMDISEISMEFTGETNFITNGLNINELIVDESAHLQVLSGNILNVQTLINKGIITVGGLIYWSAELVNEGTTYTVGKGAINEKN